MRRRLMLLALLALTSAGQYHCKAHDTECDGPDCASPLLMYLLYTTRLYVATAAYGQSECVAAASNNGIDWTVQGSIGGDCQFMRAIEYVNGTYVTAGLTNSNQCVIFTSQDLANWTQRDCSPAASTSLNDMEQGPNGLLVAAGGLGTIRYSHDGGFTWSSTTYAGNDINGITYDGTNLFYANAGGDVLRANDPNDPSAGATGVATPGGNLFKIESTPAGIFATGLSGGMTVAARSQDGGASFVDISGSVFVGSTAMEIPGAIGYFQNRVMFFGAFSLPGQRCVLDSSSDGGTTWTGVQVLDSACDYSGNPTLGHGAGAFYNIDDRQYVFSGGAGGTITDGTEHISYTLTDGNFVYRPTGFILLDVLRVR